MVATEQTKSLAVQTPEARRFLAAKQLIEKNQEQLALTLPQGVSKARFFRIVMTEIRRTPRLAECVQVTLLSAVGQAAQLGLEIGGPLGHAYLVPFKNGKGEYECQLIPGYKGLVKLARNSGQIKTIDARAVFTGDKFSYSYGMNPTLVHEPCGENDPVKMTHAYAIAQLKDGGFQMEVMDRLRIEKIKAKAIAKSFGRKSPWETDEEEMWRKTPLRKLCKMLPLTAEMQHLIEADEIQEATGRVVTDDVGPYDNVTGEVVGGGALDDVVNTSENNVVLR